MKTLKKDSFLYKMTTWPEGHVWVYEMGGELWEDVTKPTGPKNVCSLFWTVIGVSVLYLFYFPVGHLIEPLARKIDRRKGFRHDIDYIMAGMLINSLFVYTPFLVYFTAGLSLLASAKLAYTVVFGVIAVTLIVFAILAGVVKLIEWRSNKASSKDRIKISEVIKDFKEKKCTRIEWKD